MIVKKDGAVKWLLRSRKTTDLSASYCAFREDWTHSGM